MIGAPQRKPLLLVFPFGLLAHYLRCIMLCRHLAQYFDIRIAYHKNFISFIELEELDIFHYETLDAQAAVQAVKQFDFSWMNESTLERAFLEQVRIINKYRPVAVLGDYSLTLKMAASTTSVQYISLLNGYMTRYYSGQRQVSRTHPVYPFLKMLPRFIQKTLTRKGEARAFKKLHEPFNKIRQRYHLQMQDEYLQELEGDINLVCDLQNLFPQRELPPSYQIIAPLFYDPLVRGAAIQVNPNKKTLLASMGSTGDWEKLSFLNDPFYKKFNVIATGDHRRILYADHVKHFSFANIHELFPAVDLLISHGGNGTIYQSILYQVPVLCKTSHCEQEWNLAALEKKQLGKSLDGITDPMKYRKIVEEWLQKKGNHHLQLYSEIIKKRTLQLPQEIKQLADTIISESLHEKNFVQRSN